MMLRLSLAWLRCWTYRNDCQRESKRIDFCECGQASKSDRVSWTYRNKFSYGSYRIDSCLCGEPAGRIETSTATDCICWVPAEYTGAWKKYIETIALWRILISSMVPNIPEDKKVRQDYELRYYQWIPYILSLQAVLCFAPKLIFKLLYSFSDLRVTDLIQLAYRETKNKFSETDSVSKQLLRSWWPEKILEC
uniref:Innexin n=1 Tax=Ditylenchus dipsaci TaxID=166011 RepID=A0A915E7Q2_9BILA